MSVGKSHPHDSSHTHVTGESIFIDDRPALQNEVFVGVLGSPIACGSLKNLDFSKASKHPNWICALKASDLHQNKWGTITKDQPLLVEEKISYHGEALCLFVSNERSSLKEIESLIDFEVEEEQAILSIDKAIEEKDFLYTATSLSSGDEGRGIYQSSHILEGSFFSGGQEHFYLENQAAIVYPIEGDQLEVHSSSQHPTETQHVVANTLGLSYHQVVCIVKRMGGAFGGKESQAAPIAAMAAAVAHRLQRPARLVLSKDQDMLITGKRHPFKTFYKVGFSHEGKVQSLIADLYSDAGAYLDLSPSILERALFHIDGAYFLKNALIKGTVCRTNHHPHTAFRGFGGPQGNLVIESLIEDIALHLKKDPLEIRKINLYQKEDITTQYGQDLEYNPLPTIFEELEKTSDYKKRRQEIEVFNEKNPSKLRGISLTGVKFGIAFTARFLNQANALVNLHRDSTFQVSTGATEMGQGVNTKMAQIVSTAFSVPLKSIKVMATSTEKNHNTSPTAASSGTDLNGAATLLACEQIKIRLALVAKKLMKGAPLYSESEIEIDESLDSSDIEFKDSTLISKELNKALPLKTVIEAAYMNRISLSGYGHYKTPGLSYNPKLGKGKAFNYFTNGAVCSEVEIDRFTAEMKIKRVDILMDLGRSINPGIDQGQIYGAFIQGVGWLTSESLFYKQGRLLSQSPTTYKIPNIHDTPRAFNINFFSHENNQNNIYASKALGEPPFLLSISVFTAIKNALKAQGMNSPATNENILNYL